MRIVAAAVACCVSFGASAGVASAGDNLFAAIAVEPQTKAFGFGFDYSTRGAAEARALDECQKRADVPGHCKGIVWVRNGCAAVAFKRRNNGSFRYGWGIGRTKNQAINRAKNEVGDGAKRLVWTCTTG